MQTLGAHAQASQRGAVLTMSRSFLFVPGDSQRKFDSAVASASDALILDLEDSVALSQKDMARTLVQQLLPKIPSHQQGWVRVNALDTGLLLQDLVAVVPARPFGILLPKCEGRESLRRVTDYLDALEWQAGVPVGQTQILVIATETGRAIFELGSYAGVTPRLWGISWGGEDLAAVVDSLGNRADGRYTEPYRMARSLCLFAAAAAGVRPIDTVCVEISAPEILANESREAFRDGFVGKLAVHPRQIAPINEAFQASESQLNWARRVLAAFAENPSASAFNLDGQMIDQPHLRLARRLCGEG